MSELYLNEYARSAIDEGKEEEEEEEEEQKNDVVHPNALSISIARKFLQKASSKFLESESSRDEDRLVKIGRSILDLVDMVERNYNNTDGGNGSHDDGEETLKHGLLNIISSCDILASSSSSSSSSCDMKVPKVRFGKTGIQIPIVTLGCMRFQQTWDGTMNDFEQVSQECQDNLTETMYHAINNLGINHIETARGYGSSELQIGHAFKSIFDRGIKREDLIIQTKVNCMPAKDFRKTLETSFELLQLDYIDLFSFHGVNMDFAYDLMFQNDDDENLMDIIKEYQAEGKIKHIGFSTHGQPELIKRCIETDQFEYANIHYHFLGSYTASGGGQCGGNLDNIRLMKEKDMGVFIISPYDKGGKLYAPSKKLRSLILPDLEPIQYGPLWLWNHEHIDEQSAPIHTITIGAARPSDLDEPAIAAYMMANRKEEMIKKVKNVSKRLHDAEVDALGKDWIENWHKGLVNDVYSFGQIVWCHNLIKAYGMLDYAKDRYAMFDKNLQSWDFELSGEENIGKTRIGWGYTPGIATQLGFDYSPLLRNVPEKQKEQILKAIEFTYLHCSKNNTATNLTIPEEYDCAYDMRPWTAFPER